VRKSSLAVIQTSSKENLQNKHLNYVKNVLAKQSPYLQGVAEQQKKYKSTRDPEKRLETIDVFDNRNNPLL